MLEQLRILLVDLKNLKRAVSEEDGPRISKKSVRDAAEALSTRWFVDISPNLTQVIPVRDDLLEYYGSLFRRLLKLSNPNNLQGSYIETLNGLLKSFRNDLIIPIQTSPRLAERISALDQMLKGIGSAEEDLYFKEAAQCAKHDLLRASAVMGWCACIDRIHRSIEKIGFGSFNTTSQIMATSTSGRFKRFNSPQRVATIAELREVFDSNILWILEGMGLIDNNQHTRLRSCFELRCQSAHPGDAPVTEYNLLSFFSDINEIVLKNSKFSV